MTRLAVEYAELHALAGALRWQADQIGSEALLLTQSAASGDVAQAVAIAPVEAAGAERAILAAAIRADLMVLELEASALAASVAAELYRQADQSLEAAEEAADATRDWAEESWDDLTAWAYEDAYPFLIDAGVKGLILGLEAAVLSVGPPGLVPLLTGGRWPTLSHEEAVAGLVALAERLGYDTDPDLGHDPLRPNEDFLPGEIALPELMTFEDTAYNKPDGADAAPQVVVTTVTAADGSTHYIVNIPGTEPSMPLGPTGVDTDLVTLDDVYATTESERSELVQEVVAVMREAGFEPGSEVLLSGHSLGGMAAASIASDPALVDEFNVQGIATQGSPIAHYPIDSGVDVLAVEHNQDVIPQLDGADNPDRANWTTVAVNDPAGAVNPLDAHSSKHYSDTLIASQADDPAVQAWAERNKDFFGTATAQETAPIHEKETR